MGNEASRSKNQLEDNKNNDRKHENSTMTGKKYPSHWLPRGSDVRVDLTFVDVSRDANEDPDGIRLLRKLRTGIWENACRAEIFLEAPTASFTDEAKDVRKRVSRFLKTNDKYLAFGSMLFKSRFFHRIYSQSPQGIDTDVVGQEHRLPVVQLPTTKYRKPYIPLPSGWRKNSTNDSVREEDIFSFSVSHQFPFVGFARIQNDLVASITKDGSSDSFAIESQAISSMTATPPPIVGLDIVVFEKFNPRLYSSQDEFLDVFRDQFVPNEWEQCIQGSPATIRLQEFYVRWAMKEAYTKAIGVGMGLDFKSFEIQLESTDENSATIDVSVWSHIVSEQEPVLEATRPVCLNGTIVFDNNNKTKNDDEYFCFYFLPLVSKTANFEPMEGCACVCIGSFKERHPTIKSDDEKWKNVIDIGWTDLEGLAQSH